MIGSNRHKVLFGGILICLILPISVIAQDEAEFQSWADFTTFRFVSNRSALGGDAGIRGLVSSKEWTQLYVRPTYRFQYNNLDLAGGVALFYTYNKDISNVTEIRLFQQATLHWPNTHLVKFSNRLRLEQRFFNYSESDTSATQEDFFNRFRYQIGARTRDFNIFNQKIYFKGAIEFFKKNDTGNEAFINRNRFVLAVGHRLKGKWWYELHYISQRSRRLEDDGLKTSEHILRVRLFRASIFKHRIE